jgi:hypothetical protein
VTAFVLAPFLLACRCLHFLKLPTDADVHASISNKEIDKECLLDLVSGLRFGVSSCFFLHFF